MPSRQRASWCWCFPRAAISPRRSPRDRARGPQGGDGVAVPHRGCRALEEPGVFSERAALVDAFPPPLEPHYRRLSSYLSAQIALPVGVTAPPTSPLTSAVPPPPAMPAAEPLSAGALAQRSRELAHIEAQLASYIGPLARFLVKREAQRAGGIEELIARLSSELEADADRIKFAQGCRLPPGVG